MRSAAEPRADPIRLASTSNAAGHAGSYGAMPIGVHMLEVEEQQVRPLRHLEQRFARRETAGVDRRVQASPTTFHEACNQEFGLSERFAARKGHTAVRLIEEDALVFDFGKYLFF